PMTIWHDRRRRQPKADVAGALTVNRTPCKAYLRKVIPMKTMIRTTALTMFVLNGSWAFAADPVCGDVNDSSSITATDALLVLKKSVLQPIALACSAYDEQFTACDTERSGVTE